MSKFRVGCDPIIICSQFSYCGHVSQTIIVFFLLFQGAAVTHGGGAWSNILRSPWPPQAGVEAGVWCDDKTATAATSFAKVVINRKHFVVSSEPGCV